MMRRWMLMVMVAMVTAAATGLPAADEAPASRPERAPRMDGPQDGPRGERHGPPPRALTEAQEAELLDAIRQRRPEYHERLMQLKEEQPWRYRRAMGFLWDWHERLKRMDPEERESVLAEHEARIEVARLARALRDAPDDARRAELREQLRTAIVAQFAAEQKRYEARLKALEEQVKQLREGLEAREQRKDELIEERFTRVLDNKRPPLDPLDDAP